MRGYYLNNMWDFDDSNNWDNWTTFRQRTRIFFSVNVDENIKAYIRFGNQNFGEGVTYDGQWESDNRSNKFFVDAAYVDVQNVFDKPIDLRFGRQAAMYGSGWVLFDGQSQFASTSIYFDGIKLAWRVREDMILDALYLKEKEKVRSNVSPDDITMAGLYFTADYANPIGRQEVYALNRHDELIGKDIYMLGARLSRTYGIGFDYQAEGAWQLGKFKTGVDQDAYGFKLDAGFRLNRTPARPRVSGQFVRLTGDHSCTADKNEAWDVFYGGWPQYGDLMVWKYVNVGSDNSIAIYDPNYNAGSTVGGEAVYSNFNMFGGGIGIQPTQSLTARLTYSKILVDRYSAGSSDDFGDYYQFFGKYRYSEHISVAVYAAMIDPGAAFADRSDPATETFWEVDLDF
jgi:hypothetical protein